MPLIHLISGARPNYMKIAPVVEALKPHTHRLRASLIHTGQHYDHNMARLFFDELRFPPIDHYLEVGSGSHASQTAAIMTRYEPIIEKDRPKLVMVVGDVNSTIACGLVAAKLHVPVAHVEAGLRSHNWQMPEEVNRVLTDRLSHYLFTPSKDADENLLKEGIDPNRIHLVGNVMIDTLERFKPKARNSRILDQLELKKGAYGVITLHRPSNVDSGESLQQLLDTLLTLSESLPLVYPVHPRSKKMLEQFGIWGRLEESPNFITTEPLGYLDFMKLMMDSKVVLTDSGGIQEETTILGVPCITLREETERPITVTQGTNVVVGTDPERIEVEFNKIMAGQGKQGRRPELWDGKAAERIVDVLARELS